MTDGTSADEEARQLDEQLERARLVDQICRQFENAWNAGQKPGVEEFLTGLDKTIRHEALTELLAVELELRRARGETPWLDEYLRRFPESADTVSALIGERLSTDAAPPDDTGLPKRFGEFRIVREIGRGGMGVVYEAVQESLQRTVALKSLLHRIESHGDSRRRFEREARAIARLHHSHIVDVFGNGEHGGTPFFAMRFIDGEGLDSIITDCREPSEAPREFSTVPGRSKPGDSKTGATSTTEQPVADRSTSNSVGINDAEIDNADIVSRKFRLPSGLGDRERTAALIVRQIASALQYAHESGIVHRDIKPSNILIDAEGDPWLTDFGLARLSETELEASLTMEGSILGTLRYLPPESLQQTTDERGDQYSLGLTLYEMLALRPAFDRTDKAGLIHDLEHAARPALDDLQPDASRDLVTIIHKAIDREPSARYASVGELGDDLQRFLDDEPIRARRISRLEQLRRWRHRNKGLAASLSTVAVLLLVVTVGSALAAGYFRSINDTLEETVGDLTTTTEELTARTSELTVARNEAQENAAENLRLANEAETARQASQTTLADMQTERGLLAADAGDPAMAMLWFTQAARQTPHDPQREQANRRRASNWMDRSLLPVALLELPEPRDQRRLEFHPDGELLLSTGHGSAIVWDWQVERLLEWSIALTDVADSCWLADGRLAVALAAGDVQIHTVPSGEVVQRIDFPQPVTQLASSHDGRRLAFGDSTVQVWQRVDGGDFVPERAWKLARPVRAMQFNHAGDLLATVNEDNKAQVFDPRSDSAGPVFGPVPHDVDPYHGLPGVPPVFLNDNQVLTVHNRKLHRYDLASSHEIPVDPPVEKLYRLVASADGQRVVAGTFLGCTVWSPGERIDLKTAHEVSCVAISPDGQTLMATSYDSKTTLWNSPWSDAAGVSIAHFDIPRLCTFSSQGDYLAVGNAHGIRVWMRPIERRTKSELPGWDRFNIRPRPGPDGRFVTIGRNHDAPFQEEMQQLTVLDSATSRAAGPTITARDMIDSCLSEDGRSVVVLSRVGQAGRLTVYDVVTGQPSHPPVDLTANPHSLAPRPGSPTVAVLGQDGSLVVINPESGERQLELQHDSPRWQVIADNGRVWLQCLRTLYTPDGTTLITVAPDNEIFVREAESGAMRYPPIRLRSDSGYCRSVDVSADSRRLATGAAGNPAALEVWDLLTGKPICGPIDHPGDFWSIVNVRFNPDGNQVLTTHVDGVAQLWDIATGKLACPPMQHSSQIRGAEITPDGRHCLTVCDHGGICLWELHTGKRIAPPIHYPTDDRNWARTVASVEIVGDRAFVVSPDYPVVDLSRWLSEPTLNTDTLERIAELATTRRIVLGEMTALLSSEWREQWFGLTEKPGSLGNDVEQFARWIDQAEDPALLLTLAERAARSQLLLASLLRERPQVAQLHAVQANVLQKRGDEHGAVLHRTLAEQAYEAELAARPDIAVADQLAGLLLQWTTEPDWQILPPVELTSELGATLTKLDDGSILASGADLEGETYRVTASCPDDRVSALSLEVLPDASLPNSGPGRHRTGNFQLASIRLFHQPAAQSGERIEVPFASAWASYQYAARDVDVAGVIDPGKPTVWHVWGQFGEPHFAVFTLDQPLKLQPGDRLVIKLLHNKAEPLNLGRFRLSTTADHRAADFYPVRQVVQTRILGGFTALTAVRSLRGEYDKTLACLQDRDDQNEPEDGVRMLLRARVQTLLKNDEEAAKSCERLVSWLNVNTLPEALESWTRRVLINSGGLSPEAAASVLERSKLNREQRRLELDVERHPSSRRKQMALAWFLARRGLWREAALAAEQGLDKSDENEFGFWHWFWVGPDLLMAGDEKGFRRHCERLLTRFQAEDSLDVRYLFCLATQLKPGVVNLDRLPVKAFIEKGDCPHGPAWHAACCALLSYRAGDFEKAVEWTRHSHDAGGYHSHAIRRFMLSVRAMAEFQLGRKDDARATLSGADPELPTILRTLGTDSHTGPNLISLPLADYMSLSSVILYREAEALLRREEN